MIKYTLGVKRKLYYITPVQVEHVLEYGKVVSHPVKTLGGSLRLCTPKKKKSIMKTFEFEEEIVFVRYKHDNDHIIIIDIIVKAHAKKTGDDQSRAGQLLYKCHSSE